MNPAALLSSFTASPMDWIAIGLLLSLFALDAFRVGAGRAVAFSLVAPLSVYVYAAAPHTAYVGTYVERIPAPFLPVLFAGILLVLFLLANVMTRASLESTSGPLPAFLASIAATMVALTVWQQVPVLVAIWPFSALIQHLFGAPYELFWLLGAYLILVYSQL